MGGGGLEGGQDGVQNFLLEMCMDELGQVTSHSGLKTQGGGTPIHPVLRSSSSVKVVKLEK